MPTPKTKRIVVLQSSYSPMNVVADLNLTMDGSFTTGGSVTTSNLFQDLSVSGNETTRYKMTFSISGGGTLGELTLDFAGRGKNLASGVSMAKTSAVSTIVPAATTTTVTLLPVPTVHYTRTWEQSALSSGTTLVKQLGYLDVRATAGSGYTVSQVLTSAAAASLVLSYSWGAGGSPLASGTVRLDASSTVYGSYTLGSVTVVDT